jgi:hypothetical protein
VRKEKLCATAYFISRWMRDKHSEHHGTALFKWVDPPGAASGDTAGRDQEEIEKVRP